MTKLPRRKFLYLAVGAAAFPISPQIAKAQSYPMRPVRLIVGYAPGAGADITARLIGQWLSMRFGQPFVIEHRPGANTNIATEAVAHATADGYTLLLVSSTNAINATLYGKLKLNFGRDIVPIGSIMQMPYAMVVPSSFSTQTVPEFIAYAKANPGKINMASAGSGNSTHVVGELFQILAGVKMVHVPYRGSGPVFTDLLGGQVQVYFPTVPGAIEYIKAGKLRALAVTSATRSAVLPDTPSLSEFLPGYDASGWYGIGAPKNTPAEIIEKLNEEINAGLADPKLRAHLADLGATAFPSSAAEFGKFVANEIERWGMVVRAANLKAE